MLSWGSASDAGRLSNGVEVSSQGSFWRASVWIDPEYMFFYCVSLVMYARSLAGHWKDGEIEEVLGLVATEVVRSVRYYTRTDRDERTQLEFTAASVRSMFQNVSGNFDKLMTSGDPEASFMLFLMYLTRAYPAWDTIFAEGHTTISTEIIQAFGQISMSAFSLGV